MYFEEQRGFAMISNTREKTISLQGIILFCIFLATLNTINAYYYFVFIAFGLLVFGTGCRINVNASFIGLGLLGISFVIFSPFYSYSILGMLKPFSYLFCYMIGYGINNYYKFDDNNSLKTFYVVCIFVAAGSFAHYLINWVTNIGSIDSRNTVDFWTKTVIAATGQAPLACLALALSMSCVFSNAIKKYKFIAVVALLLVIGYNLILSGRTLFVLSAIILVVAFIHKLKKQNTNKVKTLLIAVGVILIVVMMFSFNIFGIMSKFERTPFYERFFAEDATTELEEDGRMDKKLYHLSNVTTNLFGGCHSRDVHGHAHDIYLDTYDETGIFGFLGLMMFIFGSMRRMWRCVTTKKLPFEFRQVVLCIYVVLYVQFLTEPILQGVAWLFASFCVIDGAVTRLLVDYNRNVILAEVQSNEIDRN